MYLFNFKKLASVSALAFSLVPAPVFAMDPQKSNAADSELPTTGITKTAPRVEKTPMALATGGENYTAYKVNGNRAIPKFRSLRAELERDEFLIRMGPSGRNLLMNYRIGRLTYQEGSLIRNFCRDFDISDANPMRVCFEGSLNHSELEGVQWSENRVAANPTEPTRHLLRRHFIDFSPENSIVVGNVLAILNNNPNTRSLSLVDQNTNFVEAIKDLMVGNVRMSPRNRLGVIENTRIVVYNEQDTPLFQTMDISGFLSSDHWNPSTVGMVRFNTQSLGRYLPERPTTVILDYLR